MSKGLQALKELKKRYGKNFSLQDDSRTRIIETALKRLEGYENHTTFTMVNQINGLRDENEELRKRLNGMYELREHYHLDQNKLKAFEIIVDKLVDIRTFISSAILSKHETPDAYNFIIGDVKRHLTQEEFDLLKKVLKNE